MNLDQLISSYPIILRSDLDSVRALTKLFLNKGELTNVQKEAYYYARSTIYRAISVVFGESYNRKNQVRAHCKSISSEAEGRTYQNSSSSNH